jgi:hypothetical protein
LLLDNFGRRRIGTKNSGYSNKLTKKFSVISDKTPPSDTIRAHKKGGDKGGASVLAPQDAYSPVGVLALTFGDHIPLSKACNVM